MKYLSVCSGIEAATQAWHPLGWEPVAFSEIDRFPSAVLAHHHPDVPNLGDMTRYREWDLEPGSIDLLVGGTPCQSFSVAGLRKGLDDPRGNLALVFLGIADRFRPRWVVWENVPGVLSSSGGRDFGAFLGGLAELGYGFAYRVLDAQYVRVESHVRAVPQRRRRVFVVGYLGDWRRAAAVLLERESLSGHPAPRRTAGEGAARGTAPSLTGSGRGVERVGESRGQGPVVATSLVAGGRETQPHGSLDGDNLVAHSLRAEGFDASEDGTGRGTPLVAHPLTAREGKGPNSDADSGNLVAFDTTQITSRANYSRPKPGDPRHPLAAGAHPPAVAFHGSQDPDPSGDVTHPVGRNQGLETCVAFDGRNQTGGSVHHSLRVGQDSGDCVIAPMAVRRLTPRECERLQGFPDDFTRIPYRGKPPSKCPDGPRYRALGNSMAVNVMRWIGERVQMVDEIAEQLDAQAERPGREG